MTSYDQIERDFIERTLKIIDQYEELVRPHLSPDNQYEVTLLMNCLLGLLIFPQQIASKRVFQRQFNSWLTVELITEVGHQWGIAPSHIQNAGYKRDKKSANGMRSISIDELTLRNLIRQMRNAAAHASFYVDDYTHQIERVEFKDTVHDDGFHMILPVHSLEIFTRKLAQSALENIQKR